MTQKSLTVDEARDWIVRWQRRRDHSERELEAKLEAKGFAAADIGTALAWAKDYAGQCDGRMAAVSAERERRRGHGPLRIQAGLEARGLDAALVGRATSESAAEVRARALLALTKRAHKYTGQPLKAAAWLSGQGFEEELVRSVVEELIGAF